ncbi:MAG: ribonuclease P protein component [Chloroflexota bacterium]|jgi:ribonuclease P protein component
MQRRHRLRNAADFALLHKQGRRFYHPLLVMIVRPNGTLQSRFGFSANRQVGKATVRNRTKRLMRESVRSYIHEIDEGWDCLFIARRGAADATLGQMKEAVIQSLSRAQLINKAF